MLIYRTPLESNKFGFGRSIKINGSTLLVNFTYNKFGDFYTANILDSSKNVIASGVRLIVGVNLIEGRISAMKFMSGMYLECSETNRYLNPSLNTLSDYVLVMVE
jgi:hypothetical protein